MYFQPNFSNQYIYKLGQPICYKRLPEKIREEYIESILFYPKTPARTLPDKGITIRKLG